MFDKYCIRELGSVQDCSVGSTMKENEFDLPFKILIQLPKEIFEENCGMINEVVARVFNVYMNLNQMRICTLS